MEFNLEGENVKLSPLVDDDLPTIKRWRRNFSLKRLTGPGPFLPSLSQQVSITSSTEEIQLGIALIETDELIGEIGLSNIIWSNRVAELGICIGEDKYRGKGVGSEALELLIEYSFRELNLYRLQLVVVDYNKRAIKSYEKHRISTRRQSARIW